MDYEKIFYNETNTNSEKTWAFFKVGETGSFATALCRAYELADLDNRRRLELAYPRLFGMAAKGYMYADDQDKFIDDLLKGGRNG